MNVQRYERQDSFQWGSAVIDSEGYMKDSPIVARTGIYIYYNPDRTIRREYRPPEEVFATHSLASFQGKPITVNHPVGGKVTPDNARSLSIGSIISSGYYMEGNPNDGKKDQFVGCDIVLYAPDDIGENRELSLGYRCDLEETPGVTPEGEAYDAIQRNIRINHLAVVKKARAGMKARLNCDGDEVIADEELKENDKMSKFNIDGVEYELPELAVGHIQALEARCDAAENSLVAMKTILQEKEDSLNVAVENADALVLKVDEQEEEIEALTKEKETLENHVDGLAEELAEAKAESVTASTRIDEMAAELESVRAEVEAVKNERDSVQARLDSFMADKDAAIEAAVAKLKADMAERSALEEVARSAKVDGFEEMDNAGLKVAVIKAVRGDSFSVEGKSEGYLDGAFYMAKEALANEAARQQVVQLTVKQQTKVDHQEEPKSAHDYRMAMIARQKEAFSGDNRKF